MLKKMMKKTKKMGVLYYNCSNIIFFDVINVLIELFETYYLL